MRALKITLVSFFCLSLVAQDRADIIDDYVDVVVIPAYEAVAQDLGALSLSLKKSATAGDLSQSRAAWRSARLAWDKAQVSCIGPYFDLRLRMDYRPLRVKLLKRMIPLIDDVPVEEFPPAAGGFPGLEWIIFAATEDDFSANTLAQLGADLAAHLQQRTQAEIKVLQQATASELIALLASEGGQRMQEATVQEAIDAIIIRQVHMAALLATDGFANPLGLRFEGKADAAALLTPWARETLRHLAALCDGLQSTAQHAVAPLLGAKHAAVADDLLQQIGDLQAAIAALAEKGDLGDLIISDVQGVTALHHRATDIHKLYATQIVSLLGVTMRFGDSDGD